MRIRCKKDVGGEHKIKGLVRMNVYTENGGRRSSFLTVSCCGGLGWSEKFRCHKLVQTVDLKACKLAVKQTTNMARMKHKHQFLKNLLIYIKKEVGVIFCRAATLQ